jgi:hypothetical protein
MTAVAPVSGWVVPRVSPLIVMRMRFHRSVLDDLVPDIGDGGADRVVLDTRARDGKPSGGQVNVHGDDGGEL